VLEASQILFPFVPVTKHPKATDKSIQKVAKWLGIVLRRLYDQANIEQL